MAYNSFVLASQWNLSNTTKNVIKPYPHGNMDKTSLFVIKLTQHWFEKVNTRVDIDR